MPGLLAFHAHPDDEVISTGGVLARYARQGEQVVVVTATDGAEGETHNYEDPEAEAHPGRDAFPGDRGRGVDAGSQTS